MVRFAPILIFAPAMAGCFYAPQQKPLPDSRTHLILHSPYYKVWDAVHEVIIENEYHIVTENPDEGAIEAEATGSFTLADADCGKLRGVASKYSAQPDPDATAVYDFQIKPRGNESSVVVVEATFTAPLHVPLHPVRGEQCVSRGAQEARLLRAISQRACNDQSTGIKPTPLPVPARETVR
jgi:hypothetical protein